MAKSPPIVFNQIIRTVANHTAAYAFGYWGIAVLLFVALIQESHKHPYVLFLTSEETIHQAHRCIVVGIGSKLSDGALLLDKVAQVV